MTPQGLIKLTAVANNIEAWRDWQEMEIEAQRYGMSELAAKCKPLPEAGWRKIDQCRKRLIKAMVNAGYEYLG
jgi:hypothetical protein